MKKILSMGIIVQEKLAREVSQDIFEKMCFNLKLWANSEIRTIVLSKSWGGGINPGHLCPPPFSYALVV